MTLFHTNLSSRIVSSSPAVSTPVSIKRLSTYVALGHPLSLCPWTGFQRITLESGSSGWNRDDYITQLYSLCFISNKRNWRIELE